MALDTVITGLRQDEVTGELETESTLKCSVGVMAYNEERNIGRILQALLEQQMEGCQIEEIIVLASGCTDNTVNIVNEFASINPSIKLVVQEKRMGKASAVNLFMRHAISDILVMESADTLPEANTIARLIEPFRDPNVGMTGGHPVPINDPSTFMGYAVHMLWQLHHQIAMKSPKLGELTAYRHIFYRIPNDSAVDEANMEPLIRGQGFQLRYVPEAIVYNRGAETVQDFLKQRRRIHAGHLRMAREQGYTVATMGARPILAAIVSGFKWDWHYFLWTPAVIGLEAYGRYLGWLDYRLKKKSHAIWDIAATTKGEVK
ncbi:MAG: glycosyltransferase [Chloroflexota bacterium]